MSHLLTPKTGLEGTPGNGAAAKGMCGYLTRVLHRGIWVAVRLTRAVPQQYLEVTMKLSTEQTRDRAYAVLTSAGYELSDKSAHGRVMADVRAPDGRKFKALVKTGSIGQAMVKARGGNPDRSEISGFEPDISYVVFAIGNKAGEVNTYLVPAEEAEAAFRKAHREWIKDHHSAAESTTWVIYFHGKGSPAANNYHHHWDRYRISPGDDRPTAAPIGTVPPSILQPSGALTIAEAKRLLASSFGVSPDNVKITIEG
jgi:hypothetical protein